jgi:hypothetical protein
MTNKLNIYTLFVFWFIANFNFLNAQTKKEVIIALNQTIDSLNFELSQSKNTNAMFLRSKQLEIDKKDSINLSLIDELHSSNVALQELKAIHAKSVNDAEEKYKNLMAKCVSVMRERDRIRKQLDSFSYQGTSLDLCQFAQGVAPICPNYDDDTVFSLCPSEIYIIGCSEDKKLAFVEFYPGGQDPEAIINFKIIQIDNKKPLYNQRIDTMYVYDDQLLHKLSRSKEYKDFINRISKENILTFGFRFEPKIERKLFTIKAKPEPGSNNTIHTILYNSKVVFSTKTLRIYPPFYLDEEGCTYDAPVILGGIIRTEWDYSIVPVLIGYFDYFTLGTTFYVDFLSISN